MMCAVVKAEVVFGIPLFCDKSLDDMVELLLWQGSGKLMIVTRLMQKRIQRCIQGISSKKDMNASVTIVL